MKILAILLVILSCVTTYANDDISIKEEKNLYEGQTLNGEGTLIASKPKATKRVIPTRARSQKVLETEGECCLLQVDRPLQLQLKQLGNLFETFEGEKLAKEQDPTAASKKAKVRLSEKTKASEQEQSSDSSSKGGL